MHVQAKTHSNKPQLVDIDSVCMWCFNNAGYHIIINMKLKLK